ncbi:MAG: ATP synthase F1 subunit delta [Legionellales bacterium]|nr:ATP synthase F1 subunit delta [Legionellales bacterium]
MKKHTKRSEAKPYAKALWNISRTASDIKQIKSWLSALKEIVETPSMMSLIESPRSKSKALEQLIVSLLPKMDQREMAALNTLMQAQRLSLVPSILEHYHQLELSAKNTQMATVTTACKLSRKAIDDISKKLSEKLGTKVKCTQIVKPELLVGFVINVDDVIYDYSLDSRLKRLANA